MVTSEQIQELKARVERMGKAVKVDELEMENSELELKTADPEFYSGKYDTETVFKRIREIGKILSGYRAGMEKCDELEAYYDMYRDGDVTEQEMDELYAESVSIVEEAEMNKMLSNEGDNLGCIVHINAGAGGTEAEDWAAMLSRMYVMWARANGYKPELMSWDSGDDSRLVKSCDIEIDGLNAYGLLKSENGVHRLVRVSPYNAQGKRMTSFASVFVTPLVNDDIKVEIDRSKLTWDTFRSSGAGGQNVNKVETGVRARYMYTDPDTGETEEILVANTETRKQHDNRERAEQMLKSILYNKALQKKLAKQKEVEDSKMKIEWGAQIRSYVLDDKRVKDHRTGYQTSDTDGVLAGDLNEFIKAYLLAQ